MFETVRLRLREYRASDKDFCISHFNTFDIALQIIPYTYIAPMTEDRVDELLQSLCKSTLFVVAESKDAGVPIGLLQLRIAAPQSLDGDIGISFGKEWWGQGFGTEVLEWLIPYSFKSLGLRRLSFNTFGSNPGAIALSEHVGFKHEGRKRQGSWREGKWVDHISMGLLASEYYKNASSGSVEEVDPVVDTGGSAADWIVL